MKEFEPLQRAISKWEGFCYNFRSTTANGLTYPIAIDQINWPHGNNAYMRDKWAEVCNRYKCKGSAALHIFYGELDKENQRALLEFVFRH